MAVASPERLRDELTRLLHRGPDLQDYSHEAARILARAVPFDGVCMLAMDPATILPTAEVVENGLPPAAFARMAQIEIAGEDFNAFAALARSERRAASLSEATEGELERSRRHREIRREHGLGDELRAVLVSDAATWGGLTLLRGADCRPFEPGDAELLASLSGALAEGVRRALLLAALPADGQPDEGPAGLVLLAPDNTITLTNEAAEEWLAELPGEAMPPVVSAVAGRARSIVDGSAPAGTSARARVQTAAGRWLLVHGSTLGDDAEAQTAVIIQPARPHELAPLIADAYALTERERVVTQLVAQGLSTDAIAGRLHLSPWTVQDHLKAIFEKVEVSTRGELVARLFFEHYAPRLSD